MAQTPVNSYVRGLVFSSATVEGSPTLRDQLSLLRWGALQVALLHADQAPHAGSAEATGAAAAAPVESSGTSASVSERYEGVKTIQVGAPSDDLSAAAAAAAAVAEWAGGQGLRWPQEVLLVGPSGDEAGRLRQWLRGAAVQGEEEEEAGGCGLAGLVVEGSSEQRCEWSRLRLALAQENLRRAGAHTFSGPEAGGNGEPTGGEGEGRADGDGSDRSALHQALLVVGYTMKASRERDLAKEGLLNLVPQDGVVFAPLDLSVPLERQLPFHAVLHKASDELELGPDGAPRFGPRVRELAAFAAAHPDVSLVDPLEAAAKVIDRAVLARVCESLVRVDLEPDRDRDRDRGAGSGGSDTGPEGDSVAAAADAAATGGADGEEDESAAGGAGDGSSGHIRKRRRTGPRVVVRAPRNAMLASFGAEDVEAALAHLGCPPPFIIKPVVACGTPDSHQMALVLTLEGGPMTQLRLPLPAMVQEFVNHDALIYKVYVAGDRVFYTVRPSIPNVPSLPDEVLRIAPSGFLTFDSLKSLPTSLGPATATTTTATSKTEPQPGNAAAAPQTDAPVPRGAPPAAAVAAGPGPRAPSQHVLERLAAHLRQQLGLSLFGFDVVVASAAASNPTSPAAAGGTAAATEVPAVSVAGASGGEAASEGERDGAPESSSGGDEGPKDEGGSGPGAAVPDVELVVIDVNYFPSYKGAKGAPALFRAAVRQSHERQQRQRLQQGQDGS